MKSGSQSRGETLGQSRGRDLEAARIWDQALRRSQELQKPSDRWEWVGDRLAPFEPGMDALPSLSQPRELEQGTQAGRRAASLWPAMLMGFAIVGVGLWAFLGGQRKAPRG